MALPPGGPARRGLWRAPGGSLAQQVFRSRNGVSTTVARERPAQRHRPTILLVWPLQLGLQATNKKWSIR